MNKPTRMTNLASVLLLTIALTACGQANAPTPEPGDAAAKTTPEPSAETTPQKATEPVEPDVPKEEATPETDEDREQSEPSVRADAVLPEN